MTRSSRGVLAAGLLVAVAGCGTASTRAGAGGLEPQAAVAAPRTPAELARADSGRPPYTAADVRFMQGMIAHHAQAVLMADWASAHGASAGIRTLAGRIAVSQQDEMAFMERWLRERGEAVPDTGASHAMAGHGVSGHAAGHGAATPTGGLAPGMLTPEQLARLAAARGPEFDALFLSSMIQHHEGALSMVRELFATPGAGQEIHVFQFASDVEADQTTEIDRMRAMLAARRSPPGTP